MPELHSDLSTCRLCSNAGGKLCSKCKSVSYCSVVCQKKDWPRHKGKCAPVVVRDMEEEGRGLVASKDIKMGDLIIKEAAVIALPADIGMYEAGIEIAKQAEKMTEELKRSRFCFCK